MAKSRITQWHAEKIFTLATKGNVVAMKKAAWIVEQDVKTHFTGGVGAIEKARRAAGGKMKTGGISPRSRPGQPPAVQEGILRSSIMSDVKIKGSEITGKVGPDIEHIRTEVEVGTDVNYGFYLEIGTKDMQPRPFLRPALKRQQKNITRIFKAANK